ncbi:hypothetical protein PRZ48_005148 [Zasmidium cellare]|uniref:Nitroreductase domain-containing protein n=1 Tax=Zasmidium cellare TaxID=395010 RepID=A0ABR0ERX1_ZASCE|nr:hypothetical protein PRZ48_005148 [Zasmidium cellare]
MADSNHLPSPTPSLEDCIRHRHSIRFYTSDPVAQDLLYESVSLARLAPSNSNIQNWRLTLASDSARDRIVSALQKASQANPPTIAPLPEQFKHFRSEFGHLLYGEQGYNIPRSAKEAHRAATMRNYEFFGAPVVGVITMDASLTTVDAMSVGMFVQTFMLALTERGLGSCLEVSVTGYLEVLREGFGIGEGQTILCGIAVGWPAEGNRVNEMVVPREEVESVVTMLRD